MTILITGGAGFIGSNLAAALSAEGKHHVVVCDRLRSGHKWRNLSKHPIDEIISPEDLFFWLEMNGERVSTVFHLGAVSSTTEMDVDKLLETNFSLSTTLWRWCAEQEKRFIYASSASTYGSGRHGFTDGEELTYLNTLRPLNPYGWSKLLFDRYAIRSVDRGQARPTQWAGLKFFNVYGPNEYHKGDQKSVVCQMFPHARAGAAVKLFKSYHPDYPDGGQRRDFIYVKDCVKVMRWLLDHPQVSGLFNVGTGNARTFDELATALYEALDKKRNVHYVDMPGDLAHRYQYFTQADMGRLRAAGYNEPFTLLEDGVREYVQHYLMQEDQYL